jgi:hypothetical protein
MKTVFSTSECFHVWAQQTQESGRGRGNVSFNGDTLYSYRWYPIARIYGNVVLLRSDRYSTTTGHHINQADRAVSHKRRVYVPDVLRESDRTNLDYLFGELRRLAKMQKRARKYDHTSSIHRALEEIQFYVKAFKCKSLLHKEERELLAADDLLAVLDIDAAKVEKRLAVERDKREREQAERDAKNAVAAAENLAAWQNGGDLKYPFPYAVTYLRLVSEGDKQRVETSKGVVLCLKECRKLWDILLRRGPLPETIGRYYRPHSFDGNTLVVGCHTIPMAEMVRVATQLGWPVPNAEALLAG